MDPFLKDAILVTLPIVLYMLMKRFPKLAKYFRILYELLAVYLEKERGIEIDDILVDDDGEVKFLSVNSENNEISEMSYACEEETHIVTLENGKKLPVPDEMLTRYWYDYAKKQSAPVLEKIESVYEDLMRTIDLVSDNASDRITVEIDAADQVSVEIVSENKYFTLILLLNFIRRYNKLPDFSKFQTYVEQLEKNLSTKRTRREFKNASVLRKLFKKKRVSANDVMHVVPYKMSDIEINAMSSLA